jgi:hypothetical protein
VRLTEDGSPQDAALCRHSCGLSPAQPCPRKISPIRLSVAETASLARLAADYAAGLITRARLAFTLRWAARRRRHQAAARWHHYSARLLAVATQPARTEGGDAM